MFQLTDKDREAMQRQAIQKRLQISEKDPFMNKPKPVWRGFHKPPTTTGEIMESLEPYETRKKMRGPWNVSEIKRRDTIRELKTAKKRSDSRP